MTYLKFIIIWHTYCFDIIFKNQQYEKNCITTNYCILWNKFRSNKKLY